MQQQLDFWPAAPETPNGQRCWETLSLEDRERAITALARLIAKAVCPELIQNSQEDNHEQ